MDRRRPEPEVRCPYDCTFVGTQDQVDDHVAYVVGIGDPDHAPERRA